MSADRRGRSSRPKIISFAFAFAILGAACSSSPQPVPVPIPSPAPRIVGPVRSVGTRLVDSSGRQVRLFGIDVTGMARGDGRPYQQGIQPSGCPGWLAPDPSTAPNVAKFGFNAIRLAISWANIEPSPPVTSPSGSPTHRYNQPYLLALDSVVRSFTSRRIAVVIEMAQAHWSPAFTNVVSAGGVSKCQGVGMPSWLYPNAAKQGEIQARRDFFANLGNVQQGYVDAWKLIAQRYASDPMVIGADMMNEPYTKGRISPADLHLNDLYVKLGSAIRSVNPHIVLVFEDSKADQDGVFALNGPPPFANEIYEFHMYVNTWIPDGRDLAEAYLARAKAWRVPLWIGEFDAFGYASPFAAGPNWQQSLQQMMAWCRDNEVSWSEFTYGDKWFLQPGTSIPRPGLLSVMSAYW